MDERSTELLNLVHEGTIKSSHGDETVLSFPVAHGECVLGSWHWTERKHHSVHTQSHEVREILGGKTASSNEQLFPHVTHSRPLGNLEVKLTRFGLFLGNVEEVEMFGVLFELEQAL